VLETVLPFTAAAVIRFCGKIAFWLVVNEPGEFFYNDCVWPHITGKVVVQ
jgi:hypothetical protein